MGGGNTPRAACWLSLPQRHPGEWRVTDKGAAKKYNKIKITSCALEGSLTAARGRPWRQLRGDAGGVWGEGMSWDHVSV